MRAYCRNKYWLAIVCAVLCCANPAKGKASAALSSPAAETSTVGDGQAHNDANQANDSNEPAGTGIANLPNKIIKDSKGGLEDLSETSGYVLELARDDVNDWRNWPKRIIEDSKESFLRHDNLVILLLAGGASVAMYSSGADEKIAENFDDNHIFHGFTDESLDIMGNPWTQFGASVLWYAISRKNQDDFSKERAESMVAALSVTGVATFGLKAIRHNETPNGKDWAWPSGHTASSFTVASMLDEFYGHKVGIPAYALASLVAYRMVDTGDHWTSDVIFGAAIGWVVGHTFGAEQKQLEIAGFEVLPYMAPTPNGNTAMGFSLVKQF